MASKVTNFEVCDLGIDHPDYFQGFGTSFTDFEHCTYGIGDNAASALDDAIESMASAGFDVEGLDFGDLPTDEIAEDEMYYHVGIRWNSEDLADKIDNSLANFARPDCQNCSDYR